ncbi:hypothetical protein BH11VER1_BH11VER1_08260 [soil metagenome]
MAKKPQKKIAKPAKSGSTSKATSKPVSKGAKVVKPAPKPVAKSKPAVKSKPIAKSKPVAKKVASAKKASAKAPVKPIKKAPTKTPVAAKKKAPAVTAKKISPSVKVIPKKTVKKPAPKAKAPVKPAPAPKAVAAAKPKTKAKAVVAPVKKAEPKAALAPVKKEAPKAAVVPVKKEAPKAVAKPEPAKAVKSSAPANLIPSAKVTKGPIIDTMPEVVIKRAYDPLKMPPFIKKQRQRLIELRSALLDSMDMVTSDGLRNRAEGSEASVGGMHMADAGSDCYDRDFALSMLSKEQDAVYEINEALARVDAGVYGVCELSAKKISDERLEALPYTRYTREMQEQIERDQRGGSSRRPVVRSVFGLDDDKEDEEGADDEPRPSASESSLDFMKE